MLKLRKREFRCGSALAPTSRDALPTMTFKSPSKSSARKNPSPEPAKPAKKQAIAKHGPKSRSAAKQPKSAPPASALPAPKLAIQSKTNEDSSSNALGELSSEVMEFITAIDEYKRQRRRPFPNWSEIFEIVKSLGYHKSA